MVIEKDRVVSIEYMLKDDEGEVLDSSGGSDPLVYIHGNENIIAGLEKHLVGKTNGDSVSCAVPPVEAYGEYDDNLVFEVPKERFKEFGDLEVGTQFRTDEGPGLLTVTEIEGETVTVDANHPLAGETLHFDVKVVDVREATAEELEHGHVHGESACGDDCGCDDACEEGERGGGCGCGCH
ncbi:MAG: peptidylprolyl isomerase [Spirochaetes bacterium]|nr:peptidylprolyl isomerase [Spirochaetota bacterium]